MIRLVRLIPLMASCCAAVAQPWLAALAADVPPAYVETVKRAGEALAGKDLASALSLADQALRLNPEGIEAFLTLGRAYLALDRHEEAISALRRAVALTDGAAPAGFEARYQIAQALINADHDEEAIQTLRGLLQLAPGRPGVHLDLGRIYLALGRLESAVDEFRLEISRHDSGRGAAGEDARIVASAYAGLGEGAYRLGDIEVALSALQHAPDTVDTGYFQGLALARVGRHEQAAQALREVLRLDPDHRGALQNLARVLSTLGLEEERRRCLDRFQKLYEEDEQRRALRVRVMDLRLEAERKEGVGDATGAASAAEEASRLAPDDAELIVELGERLLQAGNRARAEEVLSIALKRDPLNASAHYALGRIKAEGGSFDEALSLLQRAAGLEPMSLLYHTYLGQMLLRLKRFEEGVRELQLAQRLSPDSSEGAFNLGLGLAQAGVFKPAAEQMEAAVALGYKRPQIHMALAQVYRALGDTERAAAEQAIFERLNRETPPRETPRR
jgi:tetratricopeptide (TPR) repeat protein